MRFLPIRRSLIVLAVACLGAAGAHAQDRAVPTSRAQVQLSFAPVVRETAGAVVNVYATRSDRRQNAAMEEFFRRFFGDGAPGLPPGRSQSSLGSGVIVDPSGLVITNNHVIENMNEVKVALADRREFEADIVLRDPRIDLAVLKLKGATSLKAIEIGDSEALQVGDIVLAVGNPFGVGQTVTQGIVSALARTQVGISDYQFFIQTDAAINPGNSGGALIDMGGRLVGINTAIYSRSGGSIGIGFAIPSSMVKVVLNSAKSGARRVVRPWLGARLQAVDGEIATSLGLDHPTGVLITSVYDRSPAAEAGLKRGDAILAVDGQPVDNPDAFGYRFTLKGAQGQVPLTVLRGGKQTGIQVRLAPPPEVPPRDPVRIRSRSPLAGATLVNISPAVAEELQIDMSDDGVAIAELDEQSVAASVGFQKGDQIVAVNDERIASTKDAERFLNRSGGYWEITINRGGRVFTTVFGR
ncbi:Do family serine endopeptidase [Microvirga thermotolerans]|uniref:Do family serine endopeptidase n=1 Tax=Microvirga thermotolerans TaxID=2651334 RepID=A0A5P9JZU6_9HYPH|nr:Do family serine endopeptidase [Microvirga thermotolerans]QFU16795.1 Do family serine endopeptidase [Microvirga thermotolerans]